MALELCLAVRLIPKNQAQVENLGEGEKVYYRYAGYFGKDSYLPVRAEQPLDKGVYIVEGFMSKLLTAPVFVGEKFFRMKEYSPVNSFRLEGRIISLEGWKDKQIAKISDCYGHVWSVHFYSPIVLEAGDVVRVKGNIRKKERMLWFVATYTERISAVYFREPLYFSGVFEE